MFDGRQDRGGKLTRGWLWEGPEERGRESGGLDWTDFLAKRKRNQTGPHHDPRDRLFHPASTLHPSLFLREEVSGLWRW